MRTPPKTADTAGKIINRTAAEVGVEPIPDPVSSADPKYVQLLNLLNTAGEELVHMYPWENLQSEHNVVTAAGDSGDYPLPDDFSYMIDQTGWERAEQVPLFGPLSAQDWAYLFGRDLVSYTIYASFRLQQGLFRIFPQQPSVGVPVGLDIHFEYISKNWVQDGDDVALFKDEVTKNNDIPMFSRLLLSRYTKVKYLESKMLDSTKAQDSFNQMFLFISGQNKSAEVLSAGRNRRGFPYLDTYNNTPDTQYGNPG